MTLVELKLAAVGVGILLLLVLTGLLGELIYRWVGP